jgi:predicted Rossmann fold flavoprotein
MAKKLIIIGGGAAGFFLAANLKSKNWETLILEKTALPLAKVKISGGGRCNLTNATFSPVELVKNYPRGEKELLSVFSRFQPLNTFEWFENNGVKLKTFDDGCVFPLSDSSQTVIDLFVNEVKKNNVSVKYNHEVTDIKYIDNTFSVHANEIVYTADALVVTTGSSSKMWNLLERLGHKIISPVPSLFTFICKDKLIANLAGTTFDEAEVSAPEMSIRQKGILLITHQGLSGPAILKSSAFGAFKMSESDYHFKLKINWISENTVRVQEILNEHKKLNVRKNLYSSNIKQVTNRFWYNLMRKSEIQDKLWADVGKNDINKISEILTNTELGITGRNNHKEEFVTAGGVDLKEVNFKTMESKLFPNLYFAGETLNIDGLTGGFNLQACWSEAFIIKESITLSI